MYETLPVKHLIYKFDLLESLRPIIGDAITNNRDFLYKIISATISPEDALNRLSIAYRAFPEFRIYINKIVEVCDRYAPLGDIVITNLQMYVDNYRKELDTKYNTTGIKYCCESDLYVYYAPRIRVNLTERGVIKVCEE